MSDLTPSVKTTAALQNVALCGSAMQRAMTRNPNLPGLAVFYGPSGYGKSVASIYNANKTRAYFVQARSVWTKKAMLAAILTEMGVQAAKTICDMVSQIAEQLVLSGRPLMVDEADHVVDRGLIEILRDIYEASGAVVMLIGEENLPTKLKKYERVHGRVLVWAPAQKPSLEDAARLRPLHCAKVKLADDLLHKVHADSKGSVRRICVNLELAQEEALKRGWDAIDLTTWESLGMAFYTGDAPARRV